MKNSKSPTPKTPQTPQTSKTPKTPKTSKTSQTSKTPKTSKTSQTSQTSQTDLWLFYLDPRSKWRWKRTAPNGEIVGASTQGYAFKVDCEKNAERNGWKKSG